MIIILSPLFISFAFGDVENTEEGNKSKIYSDEIYASLIIAVGTVVGTVAVSIHNQRSKRKSLFHEPYLKWCISAYGTIHEFRELFYEIQKNRLDEGLKPNKIEFEANSREIHNNPVYIIHHVWEMHREAEKGYNWLGQINKDSSCAATAFNELFDNVDRLWHYLENDYRQLLKPQTNSDQFQEIMQDLSRNRREEIAEKIISRMRDCDFGKFIDKDQECGTKSPNKSYNAFDEINEFLINKIKKSKSLISSF